MQSIRCWARDNQWCDAMPMKHMRPSTRSVSLNLLHACKWISHRRDPSASWQGCGFDVVLPLSFDLGTRNVEPRSRKYWPKIKVNVIKVNIFLKYWPQGQYFLDLGQDKVKMGFCGPRTLCPGSIFSWPKTGQGQSRILPPADTLSQVNIFLT